MNNTVKTTNIKVLKSMFQIRPQATFLRIIYSYDNKPTRQWDILKTDLLNYNLSIPFLFEHITNLPYTNFNIIKMEIL